MYSRIYRLIFLLSFCMSALGENTNQFWMQVDTLLDESLRDRLGVTFYVTGSSDITSKAELAAIAYDLNEDMSIVMGTSVVAPKHFHYLDVSWRNPWTLFSWQSSLEVGFGRFFEDEIFKNRISQSISLDYPIDDNFSVQLMAKRFTKALHEWRLTDSILAMGVGLKI